jgi:hypothetical protein
MTTAPATATHDRRRRGAHSSSWSDMALGTVAAGPPAPVSAGNLDPVTYREALEGELEDEGLSEEGGEIGEHIE